MTILVTSSGNVDSPDFQKPFSGTPKSDIFIISKKSHGYPDIDTSEEMQGGSDTYYLNLDTDPDSKNHIPGVWEADPQTLMVIISKKIVYFYQKA